MIQLSPGRAIQDLLDILSDHRPAHDRRRVTQQKSKGHDLQSIVLDGDKFLFFIDRDIDPREIKK